MPILSVRSGARLAARAYDRAFARVGQSLSSHARLPYLFETMEAMIDPHLAAYVGMERASVATEQVRARARPPSTTAGFR